MLRLLLCGLFLAGCEELGEKSGVEIDWTCEIEVYGVDPSSGEEVLLTTSTHEGFCATGAEKEDLMDSHCESYVDQYAADYEDIWCDWGCSDMGECGTSVDETEDIDF